MGMATASRFKARHGDDVLSIYANELISEFNAQTLIRMALVADATQVGYSRCDIAMTRRQYSHLFRYLPRDEFAPCRLSLLVPAVNAANANGNKTQSAGIYSSDVFYAERLIWTNRCPATAFWASEMEAAELYTRCRASQARALAVLTVSRPLQTGEAAACGRA